MEGLVPESSMALPSWCRAQRVKGKQDKMRLREEGTDHAGLCQTP